MIFNRLTSFIILAAWTVKLAESGRTTLTVKQLSDWYWSAPEILELSSLTTSDWSLSFLSRNSVTFQIACAIPTLKLPVLCSAMNEVIYGKSRRIECN